MKILLNGAKGRMGQAILNALHTETDVVKFSFDEGDNITESHMHECDVAIDFSFHTATLPLVELASSAGKPVVIGTTGHSRSDQQQILAESERIPIVWSGNYSIGMNLLFYLTHKAASVLPQAYEPEITETHHHFKKDAPSGSAIDLGRRICDGRGWDFDDVVEYGRAGETGARPGKQLGIHALRGGDVVGEHIVSFFGDGERIQLKHLAGDRKIFAQGALAAARWVIGKAPGRYEMQDVLDLR